MSTPYLTLLEALRVSCNLPEFPDPLPSTQMDLELENGPTVTIDFDEETELVELFSPIGTYTPERELEIFKQIALDNFLWNATQGATLSARPEIQTVYLAYQIPVNSLEETAFVLLVEKFVKVVNRWQKILSGTMIPETPNDSSSEKTTTAPPPPQNSNFMMA